MYIHAVSNGVLPVQAHYSSHITSSRLSRADFQHTASQCNMLTYSHALCKLHFTSCLFVAPMRHALCAYEEALCAARYAHAKRRNTCRLSSGIFKRYFFRFPGDSAAPRGSHYIKDNVCSSTEAQCSKQPPFERHEPPASHPQRCWARALAVSRNSEQPMAGGLCLIGEATEGEGRSR
jgi:hypothetical protein